MDIGELLNDLIDQKADEMDKKLESGEQEHIVFADKKYPVLDGQLVKFGLTNGQTVTEAMWNVLFKDMLEGLEDKLNGVIVVASTENCGNPDCRIHGNKDDILNADTIEGGC